MFIAALFTITKKWKQPKCPLADEWISKMWSLHTTGMSSSYKKNEVLLYAPIWVNLYNIMLSEVSQTQKDKCYVIPLT